MSDIRIDDGSILKALESLERRRDITLVVIPALRKAGERLMADTKVELRKRMGKGATSTKHWNYPTLSGIRLGEDENYLEIKVSLYGDFRLKWFELGTKYRYRKRTGAKDRSRGRTEKDKRKFYRKVGKENFYRKGTRRGEIKALGFFQAARYRDEAKVMQIAREEIEKGLQNLLK